MTDLTKMVPLVIDFETTGTDPEKDRAVEVAAQIFELEVDGVQPVHTYQSFLNPGIPIPPEASAIHHLIDSDVAGAPVWSKAKADILSMPFDLFVAHNAPFDMAFFAQDGGMPEGKPVLCTWRMARKLLPDLPSYSNMALHYRLGLPNRPLEAHRALADAQVTGGLYKHLLGVAAARKEDGVVPLGKFLDWVNSPMLVKKIRFGKYYDQLWEDVAKTDRGYLKWVLEKSDIAAKDEDIRFTIESLLKVD